MNNEELLAAANPIPNITQLESEAFSIDDVVDRIDAAIEPSRPAATRPRIGRTLAAVGMALVVLVAVGTAGILVLQDNGISTGDQGFGSDTEGSVVGSGEIPDSAGYNPFIGIQQSLVSQSNQPVFIAEILGEVSSSAMYFRLATFEAYNGTLFVQDQLSLFSLVARPWVDASQAWSGPTSTVVVDIGIERLRMDWLPAPASPTGITGPDEVVANTQVRHYDGSLRLEGDVTFEGLSYSLDAEVPRIDIGSLIADDEGEPTAIFAAASAAGEILPTASIAALRAGPGDPDLHLALPGLDASELSALRSLAEAQTVGAGSAFEAGLMLEAWLHSDAFAYSVDIDPGHEATYIASWLLDPESPAYHVGYAEQFAAAMAVLARTLDIPSRVVLGFTPGEPHPDQEGLVVVRDGNAHAWVELWIPQHGWMRFDPTPRPDRINVPMFEMVGDQLGFDLLPYLR